MKSVAIFFVLLSGALGGDIYRVPFTLWRLTNETLTSENSKIYGGKIAPEGKFPYMVLVLIQDRDGDIFRCSASLVTPNWVMLAAHCVNSEGLGPENLILAGGKAKIGQYMQARLLTPFEEDIEDDVFGVQERRAAEFVKHPKFDSENFHHDIALIRLKTNFNETIKTLNISSERRTSFNNCLILGWGLSENNKFDGNLKYIDDINALTPITGCQHAQTGPFICLDNKSQGKPRGICPGDSGSPFVCNGLAWGVASHLVSRSPFPDCGDSIEEYYADIYTDLEWIKSQISKASSTATIGLGSLLIAVILVRLQ